MKVPVRLNDWKSASIIGAIFGILIAALIATPNLGGDYTEFICTKSECDEFGCIDSEFKSAINQSGLFQSETGAAISISCK